VLNQDSLTFFCTDQCRSLVTVLEVFHFFAGCLFDVCRTVYSFGIHRYEVVHFVTTVNVEQLASRAHAVSSVYIATVVLVVIHTPVVPIVRPEVFKVVDVSTFCVQHFTEYTLLSHVQGSQFKEVVYTVFKLHTVFASFL